MRPRAMLRAPAWACALALLLCSKPAGAQPDKDPPVWWDASGAERTAQAVGCRRHELVFVDPRGRVRVRPGTMRRRDTRKWEWILAEGTPPVRCTLEQDADGTRATLDCSDGTRRETFALKVAGPRRSRELEALVVLGRPAANACARAEACCPAAFALLGAKCNADLELGNPRAPDKCDGFLRGIRLILEAKQRVLPEVCGK